MKGVPQGSILGPVLFNIFLNDIFNVVTSSKLYNYADDNTVSCSDRNIETVKQHLEEDSLSLIQWFDDNQMKANPEKFQAIVLGNNPCKITFNIGTTKIDCQEEVDLLGVTIDFKLNFNSHISKICKKALRQLNVLKRIG